MIEPLHITTREELRRWYEENHNTAAEMVIPCSKARIDKPGIIRYLDAVEEALCFGWIDSSTKSVDGVFYQLLPTSEIRGVLRAQLGQMQKAREAWFDDRCR